MSEKKKNNWWMRNERGLWGDCDGERGLRKGRRGRRNEGEKGAGSVEGINESDRSRRGSFVARWVNFQLERNSFAVFSFLRGPQSLCPISFFFHGGFSFPSMVTTRLQYRDITEVHGKKRTQLAFCHNLDVVYKILKKMGIYSQNVHFVLLIHILLYFWKL